MSYETWKAENDAAVQPQAGFEKWKAENDRRATTELKKQEDPLTPAFVFDPFLPPGIAAPLYALESAMTRGIDIESIYQKSGRNKSAIMQDFARVDATPEAWGVKTAEEAKVMVAKRAEVLGRRTLGEELAKDPIMDALGIIPFSPFRGARARVYKADRDELVRRKAIVKNPFGFEESENPQDFVLSQSQLRTSRVSTTSLAQVVREYEVEKQRGMTIPGQVSAGVSELGSVMVEFMIGGSISKALGIAAKAPAGSGIVTKLAKGVKYGLQRAGIQTAITPTRVSNAIIDQQLSGEDGAAAVVKGYGDVYVENLTEVAGEGFNVVGNAILRRLPFGSKLVKAMTKMAEKVGIGEEQFLGRIARKGGWDGIVSESGEERLGTALRGILDLDDFGAGENAGPLERLAAGLKQDMQVENLLVETLVLLTPGGVKMLGSSVNRIANRQQRKEVKEALKVLEGAVKEDVAAQEPVDVGTMASSAKPEIVEVAQSEGVEIT